VVAGLVEALPQFLGQEDKLYRKVPLFLLAPIFRPVGLGGLLARLFNHRGHLQAHGNGARRTLPVLEIERQHQAGLEKAVSPAQVGLEGRSQRVRCHWVWGTCWPLRQTRVSSVLMTMCGSCCSWIACSRMGWNKARGSQAERENTL